MVGGATSTDLTERPPPRAPLCTGGKGLRGVLVVGGATSTNLTERPPPWAPPFQGGEGLAGSARGRRSDLHQPDGKARGEGSWSIVMRTRCFLTTTDIPER